MQFIKAARTGFNPRLREGGDYFPRQPGSETLVSIHASAREATREFDSLHPLYNCFNPRLREGGDIRVLQIWFAICGFNPRLREGGDSYRKPVTGGGGGFNPRLREGGDKTSPPEGCVCSMFQSTPPRGRRPVYMLR